MSFNEYQSYDYKCLTSFESDLATMGKRTQLEKTYLRHNVQFIFCEVDGTINYSSDTFFNIPRGAVWNQVDKLSKILLVDSSDLQYIDEELYFIRVENQKDQILVKLEKIPTSQRLIDPKSKIYQIQERINLTNLPASPAKNLLNNYFDEIYNDDELIGAGVPHIPFKLEHVAEAIKIVFYDPLAPQSKSIEFNLTFTAKFLVGNRSKLMTELLLKCNELISHSEINAIAIECSYLVDQDQLQVVIKSAAAYTDGNWSLAPNKSDIYLSMPCTIIGDPISSRLINSVQEDFPYLFDITGGDSTMVIDILQTIIETVEQDIENLVVAHKNRQWTDLERLPHKMKPNFKSLEREDLSKRLQNLEGFALSRNLAAFDKGLSLFLSEASELLQKLRGYEFDKSHD